MKSVSCILIGLLAPIFIHAHTVLTDFSHFTPSEFSAGFEGVWSEDTTVSGSNSFELLDRGQGSPTGSVGNGFGVALTTPQDWRSFTEVQLRGTILPGNDTSHLGFYVEDRYGVAAVAAHFSLSSFLNLSTVALPLNWSGVDPSQIKHWGFVGTAWMETPVAFSFDDLQLLSPPVSVPDDGHTVAYGLALMRVFTLAHRKRR